MNYCNKQITGIVLILLASSTFAQKQPNINDKPGTFEILSRTNYTLPECEFTKAEMTANLQKITELINTFRKNTSLSDIRGFEGRARIYNTSNCKEYGKYGVPSRISFEFCTWYLGDKGKMELGTIEPPEWSLIVNKVHPEGPQFSASGTSDRFSIPYKKETIERGIDVYDGVYYVIYNPDRPPYWVPVTVKEAYDAWIEVWENDTDHESASAQMLDIIKKKYAAIPESELNKPAYDGGPWPVSEFNPEDNPPRIVRVNPEYWDKSLPKSAIQFIYFTMINDKPYLQSRTAEALKEDISSTYQLYRFEESLDMNMVQSLVSLIGKR